MGSPPNVLESTEGSAVPVEVVHVKASIEEPPFAFSAHMLDSTEVSAVVLQVYLAAA